MAKKDISPTRKLLYYAGMFLLILGIIIFLTTFFSNFNAVSSSSQFPFQRPRKMDMSGALVAGIMWIVGVFMMSIGKSGLSGSGIILSPQGEREDLEPWNRSKGGQIKDMLEEVQIGELIKDAKETETVIKIKCQECDALNDEEDNFCGNCGKEL